MSNQGPPAEKHRPEPNAGLAETLDHRFFKALADPSRIALLVRLGQCCEPCTVGRLGECCPLDISVVSRHLAILRDAGILEAQKRGKQVYYSVRHQQLAARLRELADAIDACCPGNDPRTNRGV